MTSRPTAAIVLIGEELLSGKIDDLNGRYAIRRLREIGVDLREIRMIGDDVPTIAPVIAALAPRYDMVFTSGGVGPTHDDLTMAGIAAGLELPMAPHAEMLELIRERFGGRGGQLSIWERMARLPEGCEIRGIEGTPVPIFRIQNIWVLPGIPELFRLQFEAIAANISGEPVHIRTIFLTVGEGDIARHLEDAIAQEPTVMLGSYPVLHNDAHKTRITIEHADPEVVARTLAFLLARFPAEWVVRVGENHRINES